MEGGRGGLVSLSSIEGGESGWVGEFVLAPPNCAGASKFLLNCSRASNLLQGYPRLCNRARARNGEDEDEKTVTLDPNDSTTISFDAPISEEGTFSVEIEGLTGSYTVKGVIPGFPVESLIAGLAAAILVLWLRQRAS